LSKLLFTIEELINERELDPQYKNHLLIGNWDKHSECHIESDWLLIYRISENNLYLERTGSHSELFRK
jgi:mRNA interferase YafQ